MKWLAVFASGGLLAGAARAANTAPVFDSVVAVTGPAVLVDHPALYKFYLHDLETASNNLQLSFSSSNPTLFPTANVVFQYFPFDPDGQHWYMTLAPGFGQTGTATFTVHVSDGINVATTNIVLTVNPPPSGGARFANASAIGIPSTAGPATLYPSTVNVSGMSGTVTNVTLSVRRFSHTHPGDIHMMLVSPTGQKCVFWSKCGRGTPATDVNATITDRAFDFAPLPDEFEIWSEQFRPTDRAGTFNAVTNNFPAPAPAPPYGSVPLSEAFHNAFGGHSPNGTWSLYVYDDANGATGSIAGGWSLMVLTTGSANQSPTISDIGNQATTVNLPTAAIPFTIGDAETPAASLTLGRASSNPTLVPTNNIVFGGSGANRTVTITPATGLTGTATITVSVRDGTNTTSDDFLLTVNLVNTPPTITGIADQIFNEDTATGPLNFTIDDGQTAAASLTLGKASSNSVLVPTNSIVFGGSGSNRTVTITPALNQHGSATITLTVGDGQATTSTNFLLTVNPANDAPSITSIGNQSTTLGGTVGPLSFTIGDPESAAASLELGVASSNPTLIPTNNIVLGGSGSNRTVSATAVAGLSGSATITLSVNDGTNTTSTNFIITVSTLVSGTFSFTNAATIYMTNPLPSAANPYPSTIEVSGLAGVVSNVTVTLRGLTHTWTRDLDVLLVGPTGQAVMICADAGNGGANNVTFTLSDAAAAALPLSQLVSGTYRPDDYDPAEIMPAPAPAGPYASVLSTLNGQTPNGTWSLFVSDDGNNDVGTFAGGWSISITAVSDGTQPPTITSPGSQSINEDTIAGPLNFTLSDPDTAAGSLLVTSGSSNPALVPTNAIVLGGSGSNRTVTVTPLANASGSATISLTVSDGTNNVSTNFVLTVLPVNDVPVITGVANQLVSEDTATGPLGFIINDVETPSGSLALTTDSSNPALVPTNGIIFGGSGSNRTVTITPAPDANGTTVITLTVNDGTNSASTNFLLTVNAINDAPTITGLADQIIAEDGQTSALGLVVSDVETPADGLLLSKGSSNPSLVPTNNIVLGGSGSNRTVTITPAPDANGSTVITLTVSDGSNSVSTNFLLTVNGVNDAPTITDHSNQTITVGGTAGPLNFTVGDVETPAAGLTMSGDSSNLALVPTDNIVLGGSGSNRTVTIIPASNQVGFATITLSVSDGTSSTNTSFVFTVNRAALTVTVNSTNRVYGATNPIFTGTLAGLLPGDDITALHSTEANTNSPIGDYVITFTLDDPANKLTKYVVTTNYGTLTVSNAALTVTAASTNKIYGTGLSLTGFTANGLLNNDSVSSVILESAGTNATATVGSYAITVTNAVGVGLSNYTISYVGGSLEVLKKELLVRADDQSRIFGQTNPVFTIAYAGFVNGEGTNVLDNLPTVGTTATTASAPGGYAITLTGGADNNYEFNLSPGTLTITPLTSVRITSIIRLADNSIRIGGTGDTNFTYTMRASTNLSDLNGWPSIGTSATDGSGIFQHIDVGATNAALRFYRVEFP